MEVGDKVFYRGKEWNLIEELDAGLVRLALHNGTEEKMVERKYVMTEEQYMEHLEKRPWGRHDVWIN